MKISAIILDIGGVVLKVNWQSALSFLGLPLDPTIQSSLVRTLAEWPVFDAFERGTIAPDEFFRHLRDQIRSSHEHPLLSEAWNRILDGQVEGIDDLLAAIPEEVPLFALSNTNRAHMDFMVTSYPVFRRFRKVFASCDLGLRKPEPGIYLQAAGLIGVRPEEILFIDDLPENVNGAREVGMRAELVRNSAGSLRRVLQHYGVFSEV